LEQFCTDTIIDSSQESNLGGLSTCYHHSMVLYEYTGWTKKISRQV